MTGKPKDDLEAVREVSEVLEPFNADERERILRWVREKLGMQAVATGVPPQALQAPSGAVPATPASQQAQDIRSFVNLKQPTTVTQLAAVTAYFHRFVAQGDERKDAIGSAELVEACRKADRDRPQRPAQVMVNAYHEGLLDRAERGTYRLSTVGENLVAMVLPGGAESSARPAKRKKKARKARRR